MLERFATRSPILAFILLGYLLTWVIWLLIPTIAGEDWVLIKILTGAGIAVGLVAVMLDRLRHGWNDRDFGPGWWANFCVVATVVLGLNV